MLLHAVKKRREQIFFLIRWQFFYKTIVDIICNFMFQNEIGIIKKLSSYCFLHTCTVLLLIFLTRLSSPLSLFSVSYPTLIRLHGGSGPDNCNPPLWTQAFCFLGGTLLRPLLWSPQLLLLYIFSAFVQRVLLGVQRERMVIGASTLC